MAFYGFPLFFCTAGDLTVRSAAAVCCMGLCRSLNGRDYLRAYAEVFRSWKQEETDATVKDSVSQAISSIA